MFTLKNRYLSLGVLGFLIVALVVGAVAGLNFRSADASPNAQADVLRTINVSGEGSVQIKPDIVYVTLGVERLDPDVTVAVDDVNARMENITQALIDAGIAEEDIRTEMYNIYQETYGPMGDPNVPQANFHVMLYLNVKVRNVDAIGDVLSTAINAGANAVNNLQFGIEDASAYEATARQLALDDADARAQEIADYKGLTVTGVQSISTYGGGSVPFAAEKFGVGGGGGGFDVGSVPINSGTLTLSISVNVTYTFE